jgi:predicted phosphodiesterase
MVDWSKKQLGPLDRRHRSRIVELKTIIGEEGVREIEQTGKIKFHSLGDSGVNHAEKAEVISDKMSNDYNPAAGGSNPAFLFHLGDVIYGPGKKDHYGERFYRPYRHYPGKIIAIPGNHDGEQKVKEDQPSLTGFLQNFCSKKAAVPLQASGSGIYRETMTLPGAYWMLEAPFVRIMGLYSNLLENPGFLEAKNAGGMTDNAQIDWLNATLARIAAKPKKALIIATHHPPYSQSGHSGSAEMNATIDKACEAAGMWPDLFISGHAHNYQRYTRQIKQKQIPYVVAGTGGMPPQPVVTASNQVVDKTDHLTYDGAFASLGYLLISVSTNALNAEFRSLDTGRSYDPFNVDLVSGKVSHPRKLSRSYRQRG